VISLVVHKLFLTESPPNLENADIRGREKSTTPGQ